MAFQRATRSRISARRSSSFSESRPRSPAHTLRESVGGAFSLVFVGVTNSVERPFLIF